MDFLPKEDRDLVGKSCFEDDLGSIMPTRIREGEELGHPHVGICIVFDKKGGRHMKGR